MAAPWDVIVTGGGMAGLVAATRAAELGLHAVVLEQGEEPSYLCNTRLSGGALHLAYASMTAEPAVIKRAIEQSSFGYARSDLAAVLAEDSARVIEWLKKHGAKFVKGGAAGYLQHMLAPPIPNEPGLHWHGRAGDVLLRTLEDRLVGLGGQLVRGCRVEEIATDTAHAIKGVVARTKSGSCFYEAPAVVIADGGFQDNREMVRQYITAAPEKLKQRGSGTGLGYGARMAAAVGAKLIGMESFYGHLLCRDAMTNDKLWPHPQLDFVGAAGIVVDERGRRIADEGQGGIHVANCVARLPDPLGACVVFDERIWNGPPGRSKLVPPNPYIEKVGGTVHAANSLVDLAHAIGVPAAALSETVSEYNAAVKSGKGNALRPSRTTDNSFTPFPLEAYPIEAAPFRAIPLCVGITYTMGGIAIDRDARVLSTDDRVIEGLYAAGVASGGIEGGPFADYVGGLAKSAIFGLRAAEAARSLR